MNHSLINKFSYKDEISESLNKEVKNESDIFFVVEENYSRHKIESESFFLNWVFKISIQIVIKQN